jgi:hypothetical protein
VRILGVDPGVHGGIAIVEINDGAAAGVGVVDIHVGVAVMMEGVTSEALKQTPRRRCPPWWQIKFEIYTHDPNTNTNWVLDRTGGGWQGGIDRAGVFTLFARFVAALRGSYFTASMPPRLLSHHCMICGKGLTDPASMARWIGPECAGTSTLQVPFLITSDQLLNQQGDAHV